MLRAVCAAPAGCRSLGLGHVADGFCYQEAKAVLVNKVHTPATSPRRGSCNGKPPSQSNLPVRHMHVFEVQRGLHSKVMHVPCLHPKQQFSVGARWRGGRRL